MMRGLALVASRMSSTCCGSLGDARVQVLPRSDTNAVRTGSACVGKVANNALVETVQRLSGRDRQ